MHNGYSETARVHVGRAAVRVTKVYWPGFSARKYCAVGVSWRTGPRFRVQRRRVSEDWALALTHWPQAALAQISSCEFAGLGRSRTG